MAYRRTERVEARLADNRARILHGARTLVREHGFRDTQIASIASAAGIAVGTIYSYFPSKAELFAEVVRMISQREVDVVAEIGVASGAASERLAAALRAIASRAIRGRRLAYAVIAEPVDPEVDAARLEYRRIHCRVFERLITAGIDAREFPPQNARASAAGLVGALFEALVGPLAPESGALNGGEEALIDSIVNFGLRAVSGKEPP